MQKSRIFVPYAADEAASDQPQAATGGAAK